MKPGAEAAVAGGRCRGRWVKARRAIAAGCLLMAAWPLRVCAADPVPVIAQSAAGRFEVSAVDSSLGHAVAAQAEEGWRLLAGPLGLPERFGTPIYVRLVDAATMGAATPLQAVAETGGVVSVRVRADGLTADGVRRAIVRGLLMRLAVAQQGVTENLRVPRWLEEGCVGWWHTRADGARLDALRQQSARLAPPALGDLLQWRHGPTESPGFSAAALWLTTFFQAESRRTGEWAALIKALLAGDEPDAALAASYPGRFAGEEERELWWQTGWHQVSRARALPALDPADSRAQLGALARFVFAGSADDTDIVVPLREVVARAGEPIVAAEFSRRAGELGRLIPVLHPFYRNAGLSLGEVLGARAAKSERRAALCAVFEQDWRDAIELEAETTAALDALEAKRPRR